MEHTKFSPYGNTIPLVFAVPKFIREIRTGSQQAWRQRREGWVKSAIFYI